MRPSRATIATSLVLVLLGVVLVSGACGFEATPRQIQQDPDKFDGKTVTIRRTVTQLRSPVSQKGNTYYTYDLDDGDRTIRVFSFGKAQCGEGVTVTVTGLFTKVKHVSGRTFYNEVEAQTTRCNQ